MASSRPTLSPFVAVLAAYLAIQGGPAWSQPPLIFESQALVPGIPQPEVFGLATALRGSVAAVTSGEVVHIYRRNAQGMWQLDHLASGTQGGNENYGLVCAVDGDLVAVSARDYVAGFPGDSQGAVYLYRYNGSSWSSEGVLQHSPPVSDMLFGMSIALSGDVLACTGVDNFPVPGMGFSAGSAHIFRDTPTGWVAEATFRPHENGPAGSGYGSSPSGLATDGQVVVVGDLHQADFGPVSGAVYVYRYSAGTWAFEQRLTSSDLLPQLAFGSSVGVHGSVIAVGARGYDGARGAVYVFRFTSGAWQVEQRLDGDVPMVFFGSPLSVQEDTILVGRSGLNEALLYRFDGLSWNHSATLRATSTASNAFFGLTLALDDDQSIVAAPGDNAQVGSAFYYDLSTPPFIRGDTNSDGAINIADPIATLGALFTPGAAPLACTSAADANDDGALNIADAVFILGTLFSPGSPSPSAPFPDCGPDPTADGLSCLNYGACP